MEVDNLLSEKIRGCFQFMQQKITTQGLITRIMGKTFGYATSNANYVTNFRHLKKQMKECAMKKLKHMGKWEKEKSSMTAISRSLQKGPKYRYFKSSW